MLGTVNYRAMDATAAGTVVTATRPSTRCEAAAAGLWCNPNGDGTSRWMCPDRLMGLGERQPTIKFT